LQQPTRSDQNYFYLYSHFLINYNNHRGLRTSPPAFTVTKNGLLRSDSVVC